MTKAIEQLDDRTVLGILSHIAVSAASKACERNAAGVLKPPCTR
jgi:hypothetical protein